MLTWMSLTGALVELDAGWLDQCSVATTLTAVCCPAVLGCAAGPRCRRCPSGCHTLLDYVHPPGAGATWRTCGASSRRRSRAGSASRPSTQRRVRGGGGGGGCSQGLVGVGWSMVHVGCLPACLPAGGRVPLCWYFTARAPSCWCLHPGADCGAPPAPGGAHSPRRRGHAAGRAPGRPPALAVAVPPAFLELPARAGWLGRVVCVCLLAPCLVSGSTAGPSCSLPPANHPPATCLPTTRPAGCWRCWRRCARWRWRWRRPRLRGRCPTCRWYRQRCTPPQVGQEDRSRGSRGARGRARHVLTHHSADPPSAGTPHPTPSCRLPFPH